MRRATGFFSDFVSIIFKYIGVRGVARFQSILIETSLFFGIVECKSYHGDFMTDHNLKSFDIPDVMKAMVLKGHGGLDQLVWHEDWPVPTPQPGHVLIRVGACGLNNTDINTRTAWYSKEVTDAVGEGGKAGFDHADDRDGSWSSNPISFPRIQGADVTGYIVAVGDGVDPQRIGQRILVDPWILSSDWQNVDKAIYFGSECDGGFAEFTTVPSQNAVAIKTDLSDAELATFSCAITTAENLVNRTGLKPGETVVIAGASGGVGAYACQLSLLRGAQVIALSSPSKSEALKKMGVHHVIDRNSPNLAAEIKSVAGGDIAVALDVVGGKMTSVLTEVLAQFGRYSTSGAIAGSMIDFDLRSLVYKDLQMTGATIVPPGTMARLVALIENGLIKPNLAASYPLAELHQAQQAFLEKRHFGNIVVTC